MFVVATVSSDGKTLICGVEKARRRAGSAIHAARMGSTSPKQGKKASLRQLVYDQPRETGFGNAESRHSQRPQISGDETKKYDVGSHGYLCAHLGSHSQLVSRFDRTQSVRLTSCPVGAASHVLTVFVALGAAIKVFHWAQRHIQET